jgi:hypothetical protein
MSDDSTGVSVENVRHQLGYLKRNGCNLLVTGNVGEEVSHKITRKLLGAPDISRTRILGLTNRDREDAVDLLPDGVRATDERVHFIEYDCGTRTATAVDPPESASAAGADPAATDSGPASFDSDTARVGSDLDDLRNAFCDAITTAKIANSGFESAELRISLLTLSHLVDQYDSAAVDRFVSAVADHVRGVSGMAHYHLPVADDSRTVRRFSSLFDARIELRKKQGRPEQRLHFSDGVSTVWFGL